jgi:protein gp37
MTIHPAIANLSPERRGKGIYWQRSWNVVRGCSHVSPGCDHCWLEAETARHAKHPNPKIALPCWPAITAGKWSGNLHLDLLALPAPLRVKKPTVWAVWSDLFHEKVTDEFLDRVFAVMALAPRHLFVVLTKRPARMLEYLTARSRDEQIKALERAAMAMFGEDGANMLVNAINGVLAERHNVGWPMHNVILMTTIEDQPRANERGPIIAEVGGMGWKTGVSVEPMLGGVDLTRIAHGDESDLDVLRGQIVYTPQHRAIKPKPVGAKLDWVIAGGESGPGARPMHPDWLRSLRDQCAVAGVPFLFKQWGALAPWDDDNWSLPSGYDDVLARDGVKLFGGVEFLRVGKRRAGRLLDGVTHDVYPGESA